MKLFYLIDSAFEKIMAQKPLVYILLAVIILRIPSLFEPYWYGDEAIYLAIGEGLRQGKLLYRDIFDHKPPLIYLLAALSGSLFWFKWTLLVWHTATVILFWNFCKTLFSTEGFIPKNIKQATILSTVIFALLTTLPTLEGNIVNAELFMVGPILAGFTLLLSRKNTLNTLFWSGLLFSLAALFKIPALFEISAIFIYWLISSIGNTKEFLKFTSKLLIVGAVILLPFFLLAIYYIQQNSLPYYLQGVFSQNLTYINSWSTPTESDGFSFGLIQRAIILLTSLGLVFFLRKRFDKLTLFVAVWLLVTTFAMLLSGRPYPHYVIQVIAPTGIATSILVFGRDKHRFLVVPLILFLLLALSFYKFSHYQVLPYYKNFLSMVFRQETKDEYFQKFDAKTPGTYKLANLLEERLPDKEPIFIWGTLPELYALSRHLPPTRYIVSFHVTGFKGEEETIKSLEEKPTKYIIRSLSERNSLPGFESLLRERYGYETTLYGNEIWRRVK